MLGNEPELADHLEEVWEIFLLLSSSRTYSYGANPIQLSEMVVMLNFFNVTNLEDRYDYIYFIRQLDDEWLKLVNTKK